MTYFIYLLCLLITGAQAWNIYHFKPMGGDRAMSQAWLMIQLGVLFFIITVILFISMTRKGCFSWVSEDHGRRNLIVIIFCICYVVSVFFSGIFKTEWYTGSGYPFILRYLSQAHAYIWIPLCVLVPFYFLLNAGADKGLSLAYVKYPLYTGIIFSGLYSGLTLFGWIADQIKTANVVIRENKETNDRYHLQNLETIKNYKADESIYGLLSYAYVGRPSDIHEAALQKIKERSDWEEQILNVLKNREQYTESYYFLSGNQITQAEKFRDPMLQSIVSLAVDVGEFLKESNNFQDWTLDHFHIPMLLEALDFHFSGDHNYFSANVLRLKNSIQENTPQEAQKIKFNAMRAIDSWLSKNKIQ